MREVNVMNVRIMKYVGIAIMILAHPVGYYFWNFIILGPFAYSTWYTEADGALLRGVGILEFFLVGLSLFVFGVFKDNKGK